MTPEQQRALAPLLPRLCDLLAVFKEDDWGRYDHLMPAVYLELHQWRRILEAFND